MTERWTDEHYAVLRALLGLYLCIHFLHLLPWSTELFSSQGMLPDAGLSPLSGVFPGLFGLEDDPWFVHLVLIAAAGAALCFAAGRFDRPAAILMWLTLASLHVRNPLIANPSLPYVGFLLIAHLFAREARWRRATFMACWIVLALSYSYSGYTKLLSPSWVAGDNIRFVLENPLARDYWLRDVMLAVPPVLISALTWFVLYVELLFAPLALLRCVRPWIWGGMLVVQCGFLLVLNFADLTLGMLLFHLATFDPAWIRPRPVHEKSVLFYDGRCALCHGLVGFVLREDRGSGLRFAPLQGDTFRRRVPQTLRSDLPDSIVLDRGDGRLLLRSSAVVQVLLRMGGIWPLLGVLLWLIPRPLRDAGYDLVGALRYRLFGEAAAACPLVPAGAAARLIAD